MTNDHFRDRVSYGTLKHSYQKENIFYSKCLKVGLKVKCLRIEKINVNETHLPTQDVEFGHPKLYTCIEYSHFYSIQNYTSTLTCTQDTTKVTSL